MIGLPDKIKHLIGEEKYALDDIGLSDSTVILFRDTVLKIQSASEESYHEYQIMQWLQDRLPVPRILGFERHDKKDYLLMTRISGEMACKDKYLDNPEQLTHVLAKGLQRLWKVDIDDCPYICNLEEKLRMARYNVENGLVNMEDAEPDTFGEDGFKDPSHLLEWLNSNKPEEELVFSHGDFCLPNIYLSNGDISGYLDLGRAGIADRWFDIALCYRSLMHNFNGKYTGKKYQGFSADMLFKALGMKPDWEKIRYYILLDELF